jgi:hypothetical protein
MNPTTRRRGSSLDTMPSTIEAKPISEPKPVRKKSKQTIEIDRKALSRIRGICVTKGISFQDFAIRGINRELEAAGEPSVEELEAGE